MKLITDPEKEITLGFVSDSVLFAFDKDNNPVEIGRVVMNDDPRQMLDEWRAREQHGKRHARIRT